MPVITGGMVVPPGGDTIPDSKQRITWVEGTTAPTDAVVAGSTGRTPANGEIASTTGNGNIYERQAGVWTRIDTL